MDATVEAAVGAGDDVFLADDFSERDEWVFEAKKRFGTAIETDEHLHHCLVYIELNIAWSDSAHRHFCAG
jgi:hypothetical protein